MNDQKTEPTQIDTQKTRRWGTQPKEKHPLTDNSRRLQSEKQWRAGAGRPR